LNLHTGQHPMDNAYMTTLFEEAALKSYIGSQAIQAATWLVTMAFPEYFKREMNCERVDKKSSM
jgi:hypothetical protein